MDKVIDSLWLFGRILIKEELFMVEKLLLEIEQFVGSDDFEYEMEKRMNQIEAEGAGIEIVEKLLQIMERHPLDDFGVPGAMVHFIEKFDPDYEPLLVASLKRSPSLHTVWMLNRCINGGSHKDEYMNLLTEIANGKDVDEAIKAYARELIDFQNQKQ